MKSREFSKKLGLNKKTIAHLAKNEMGDVRGASHLSICWDTCRTCQDCPTWTGTPNSNPCCETT